METLQTFTISNHHPNIRASESINNSSFSISYKTLNFSNIHHSSNETLSLTLNEFIDYLNQGEKTEYHDKIKVHLESVNSFLLQKHGFAEWNKKDVFVINMLGRGSYGAVDKVYDQLNNSIYVRKTIFKAPGKKFDFDALNELKPLIEIIKIDNNRLLDLYYLDYEPGKYCAIYMAIGRGTLQDIFSFIQTEDLYVEGLYELVSSELNLQLEILRANLICHRDIKPSNILISEKMFLKLGDFGSAQKLDHDGQQEMRVAGTLDFMRDEIRRAIDEGAQVIKMDPFDADEYAMKICLNKLEEKMKNRSKKISLDEFWVRYPGYCVSQVQNPKGSKLPFFKLKQFMMDGNYFVILGIFGRMIEKIKTIDSNTKFTSYLSRESFSIERYEEVGLEYIRNIENLALLEKPDHTLSCFDLLAYLGKTLLVEKRDTCKLCFETYHTLRLKRKELDQFGIIHLKCLLILSYLIQDNETIDPQSLFLSFVREQDLDVNQSEFMEVRIKKFYDELEEGMHKKILCLVLECLEIFDKISDENKEHKFVRLQLYTYFIKICVRSGRQDYFFEGILALTRHLRGKNYEHITKKFYKNGRKRILGNENKVSAILKCMIFDLMLKRIENESG